MRGGIVHMIKILLSLLICSQAFGAITEADKAMIFNKNLLKNGGFESGLAQWTASAGTFTHIGVSEVMGLGSARWDSSASTQTLTSTEVTIPNGMKGRNGVVSCLIKTPSGTATHSIQAYDGTNILSSVAITSNALPVRSSANFIFPSSGTISLRLYSNANEPQIYIDDCFVGPAEGFNMSNVSQASFVGGMENAGASTCTYSQNSSTSISNFVDLGTSASCAAWTVVSNGPGTISAQATNDHRLVYTNMPPGEYVFKLAGLFAQTNATAGNYMFRLSDGTTTYQPQAFSYGASAGSGFNSLEFHVSVTTAGTRTYKLQAADNAVITVQWYNYADYPASWKVYRFPSSTEQAYRPDMLANSWSGYHDNTCSWARTSATLGDPTADASCALVERTNMNFGTVSASGSVLPAITFTPKRAGRYYVCAIVNAGNNSSGTTSFKLWDGTTSIAVIQGPTTSVGGAFASGGHVCGIYTAASTSPVTLNLQIAATANTVTISAAGASGTSAIEWSIFQIDQSIPAPLLAGGVVSSSSGVVKIVSAFITNSGTPTVTRQDGSWISSLTDNALGDTTINFTAGTFSTIPNCFCHTYTTGAVTYVCEGRATTPISSSLFRMITFATTTGAAVDTDFFIQCIGAP
jgi:hypothetical protein